MNDPCGAKNNFAQRMECENEWVANDNYDDVIIRIIILSNMPKNIKKCICKKNAHAIVRKKEEFLMKKKMLAWMMAVCMAAGLVACGGSSSSTASDAGSSAEAEDSNTLTVWCWDKTFNIYAMEEAEKIYQQENPDVTLQIEEVSWDDMQTKLATIVGSGSYDTLPDILLMQDYAYEKYVTTYPDLFQDLTESGIDFTQFGEAKLSQSTIDGKNYGVPFDNGTTIAAYRTDILEQAGYTVDDLTDIDWDRFIEIGQDVLAQTGYSLLSVQAGSSDLIYQMMTSAGLGTWNDDGTPALAGNENLIQCFEIYKEMVDTGVLAVVNSWDEYIATFTSGKTCGVINGCWILASVQTASDQSGLWNVTSFPSLPGVATATNYSNQGGSTWAITSNCKNTELAVDFLSKTFAGSVELYETILPSSGALATYLPAGESDVYSEPQEFFGGQAVYSLLTDYASKVPSVNLGVYYTEANTALATALANVVAGSDIESELANAQSTTEFDMGQ